MNNSDSSQSLTPPETEKVLALAARLSVEQKKQENLCSITELLSAAQAADIEEKYVHQALASLSPIKAESAGSIAPVGSDLAAKKDGLPVKLKFFEGKLARAVAKAGFSLALASLIGFWSGKALEGAFPPPPQNVHHVKEAESQTYGALYNLENMLAERASGPNSDAIHIVFSSFRYMVAVMLFLSCLEICGLEKNKRWPAMARFSVLLGVITYLAVLNQLLALSSPALIIAFFAGTSTFAQTWLTCGFVERISQEVKTLSLKKLKDSINAKSTYKPE